MNWLARCLAIIIACILAVFSSALVKGGLALPASEQDYAMLGLGVGVAILGLALVVATWIGTRREV